MTFDEFFVRRAVVLASAVIYWGGVAIQARRIRKRTGRSANVKPRTPREKALWLAWALMILGWMIQPVLLNPPHLPPRLGTSLGFAVGIALTVSGYACTLWCYAAMGNMWRIGVNPKEKTQLVTRGPYKFIRHPIYGFQLLMLIGAAFLLPTLFSFLIIVLHFICVQFKAADEEAYLLGVHAETYRDYLKRTGRLFPKIFP